MFGKLHLRTLVLIPVGLGNFWGFFMPAKINSHFADSLSMMVGITNLIKQRQIL